MGISHGRGVRGGHVSLRLGQRLGGPAQGGTGKAEAVSDLLDLLAAQEAKAEAIQRAGAHARPEWKEAAARVIHDLALTLETFTTDQVWEALANYPQATHEPRALGALMQEAAKAGAISATNEYRNSARPACHSRPVRVWRSNFYKGN